MPKIYIDAEYLLKELSFYADRPTKSAMNTIKGLAMRPDPDVVKVVRCRACKWWDEKKRVCEHPEWTEMGGWHRATEAEDYCFRAERKEKTDE